MRRALLLALLAGCVTPDPDPRFTPAWEPFDPEGAEWKTTRKALLVSDCQFHNNFAKPVPERNLAIKALVGTAIRPPQLDLFSRDVLTFILADGATNVDVVLHLGDALDLAVSGEFDTFLEVMATAKKPWFMCPGNHDAYYFGNFDPEDTTLWQNSAAYEDGEILTKDKFIRRYVAAMRKQDDDGVRAFAAAVPDPLPPSYEWRAPPDTKGFLDAIAWSIDAERPWRSFIIQQIDLTGPAPDDPHVSVYLLDSCQYGKRPELVPNAWECYPLHHNCGVTGEMLADQLRTLRGWVEGGPGGHGVLMCHHPFMSLAPRSKSSLGWLWREHKIGLMVTAHTHEGWYKHHSLGDGLERLELNLGSTTDWPMEWRTLEAYARPGGDAYIRATRYTLVETLRERGGYFDVGWEVPLDAPDDYRHYKQGEATPGLIFDFYLVHHVTPRWMNPVNVKPNKAARATEAAVKDTMLHTYARLVRMFPTSPEPPPPWPQGCDSDAAVLGKIQEAALVSQPLEAKIALLKQLETFERGRHSKDPKSGASTDEVRVRYRISQAAWASRFEKAKGRRLQVEDDLIRVASPQ